MTRMSNVVVVEDEVYLADAIAAALTAHGRNTRVAYDGATALELLEDADVVVLDRDLPRVHGDEVCARIRTEHPHIRVLMLTAASALDDRLAGFASGADDYLTKPFEVPELLARVDALLRRHTPPKSEVLRCADVRMDTARRTVTRAGTPIPLSPKEFAVLEVLLAADGAVLSAETLLEEAWDAFADPFTNSPRVTISHLRRKLGDPWIIHTQPGAGYYAAEEARP